MDDITEYKINDPRLRAAMLSGFGGRCFYTGQKVTEANMAIDHVVPKNKGGKDSVLNYALTTRLLNNHKATFLDEENVKPILYIIETVYAPRVLKQLLNKKWENTGNRVSIYMQDDEFNSIQVAAKRDGRSVSNYLVQLHKMVIRDNMGFIDEAGSISEEAYANIETGNKPAQSDKFETRKPIIPKEEVKKVIEEIPLIPEASDFFKPQPKGKK